MDKLKPANNMSCSACEKYKLRDYSICPKCMRRFHENAADLKARIMEILENKYRKIPNGFMDWIKKPEWELFDVISKISDSTPIFIIIDKDFDSMQVQTIADLEKQYPVLSHFEEWWCCAGLESCKFRRNVYVCGVNDISNRCGVLSVMSSIRANIADSGKIKPSTDKLQLLCDLFGI